MKRILLAIVVCTTTSSILHSMDRKTKSSDTADFVTVCRLALTTYEETGKFSVAAFCDVLCDYTAQIPTEFNLENHKSENKPLLLLLKNVSLKEKIMVNSPTLKNFLETIHVRETERQLLIFEKSSEKAHKLSVKEALTEDTQRSLYQKCFAVGCASSLAVMGIMWSIPKLYHWLRS